MSKVSLGLRGSGTHSHLTFTYWSKWSWCHRWPLLQKHTATIRRDTLGGHTGKKKSQGILGLPVLEGRNSPTHSVSAAFLGPWPHSGPSPARQAPGNSGHGPLPALKEHGAPGPRPSPTPPSCALPWVQFPHFLSHLSRQGPDRKRGRAPLSSAYPALLSTSWPGPALPSPWVWG